MDDTNQLLRDKLTKLIELQKQQIETEEKLIKATHVSDLTGIAMKGMDGFKLHWVWPFEKSFTRPWARGKLYIQFEKGSELVYPAEQVPLELWPAEMRLKYSQHVARQAAARMKPRKEEVK